MAGTALSGRLTWQFARVIDLVVETARAKSIVLDLPGWPGHRAGQHVDVRLTAEDGYQAQRSYTIASAPDGGLVELTVERLDDGEVSPYLTDVLELGDELELRGPIGGYFVWEASLPCARWWRSIDITGTSPEPPATRYSGPPSVTLHANQPPIGPRSSNMSPGCATSTSHGESSPSPTRCTVIASRWSSGAEAIE